MRKRIELLTNSCATRRVAWRGLSGMVIERACEYRSDRLLGPRASTLEDRVEAMKKFLNSPQTLLDESLDGFVAAHSDVVVAGEERKFVRRKTLTPGKVALISGGGSGHEPLHAGFVGTGMLDAACPGQVFTSPTPDQVMEAMAAVDGGAGCLLVVKNYEGDVMNFDMAAEMASGQVARIVTDDDVA